MAASSSRPAEEKKPAPTESSAPTSAASSTSVIFAATSSSGATQSSASSSSSTADTSEDNFYFSEKNWRKRNERFKAHITNILGKESPTIEDYAKFLIGRTRNELYFYCMEQIYDLKPLSSLKTEEDVQFYLRLTWGGTYLQPAGECFDLLEKTPKLDINLKILILKEMEKHINILIKQYPGSDSDSRYERISACDYMKSAYKVVINSLPEDSPYIERLRSMHNDWDLKILKENRPLYLDSWAAIQDNYGSGDRPRPRMM